jgi:hypothetical protein
VLEHTPWEFDNGSAMPALAAVQRAPSFSSADLCKGRLALCVFGTRYAPDYGMCLVPGNPVDVAILATYSGVIGNGSRLNTSMPPFSTVSIIGYFRDNEGRLVNTYDYAAEAADEPFNFAERNAMGILYVAPGMEHGKSTTAKAVTHLARHFGHPSCYAKVLSCGSNRDAESQAGAGARAVVDHTALGIPSTYRLPEERLPEIFWKQTHLVMDGTPRDESELPLVVNIELSDGLWQPETNRTLAVTEIQQATKKIVLAVSAAPTVPGLVKVLNELGWSMEQIVLAGPLTSKPIYMDELRSFAPDCGRLPYIDSMAVLEDNEAALTNARQALFT